MSILATLNKQQLKAVSSFGSAVLVNAGPGTGKTHTVVSRIFHGVQTGHYRADKIMALTFTNKAAAELKLRLSSLGIESVNCRTFHSAAVAQLSYFWPLIIGGRAPNVLANKSLLLKEAAKKLGHELSFKDIKDISYVIETSKNLGVEVLEFLKDYNNAQGKMNFSKEIVNQIVIGYEQIKNDKRQLDFDDVLHVALGMTLREPRVSQYMKENYRHFLVDEFQDVSPVQFSLLQAWMGERNDVFAVGDPNQTIYSFAGASKEFINRFTSFWPDAHRFDLTENYRSKNAIVSFAKSILSGPDGYDVISYGGFDAEKSGRSKLSGEVSINKFSTAQIEAKKIANVIMKMSSKSNNYGDFAVLYRQNSQCNLVIKELSALKIPYTTSSAETFFSRRHVKQALHMLEIASNNFYDKPLGHVVSDVLRPAGLTEKYFGNNEEEYFIWQDLRVFVNLVEEKPDLNLAEFVDFVNKKKDDLWLPKDNAVSVLTAHASKGGEWKSVFVPSVNSLYYSTSREDDLNVLYVAVTRAESELFLSYISKDDKSIALPVSGFLSPHL